MGKGKKKVNKGNKKNGKTRDDEGNSSTLQIEQQMERVRLEAADTRVDPLKNWTRLQNEDCPICMLPFPIQAYHTHYCVTCGTTVCVGCMISTCAAHARDGGDAQKAVKESMTCPYCRSNAVNDDKFRLEKTTKLANAGHHEAMYRVGGYYFDGEMGLRQDKAEGLKWYHRAVEAGSGRAAYSIGGCYTKGDGVEQDIDKALEYYQKATELEYIPAFQIVGVILLERGEIEEGMLNYRKAAICGLIFDSLFDELRNGFKHGFITKDEYAFTLRENQKACYEMKSEARDFVKKSAEREM